MVSVKMDHIRMLDKSKEPAEGEMIEFIGKQLETPWSEIHRFIKTNYDHVPETKFYGEKYGWTVRYRRSGRTICSLFPEKGAFTVLVVLGKKESEKAFSLEDVLESEVRKYLEEAKQLRDGRWLWIRVLSMKEIDGIKKLLRIKRKPMKK